MTDRNELRGAPASAVADLETDEEGFGLYDYPPVAPPDLPILMCWVAVSLVAVALLAIIEQLKAGPDLLAYLT